MVERTWPDGIEIAGISKETFYDFVINVKDVNDDIFTDLCGIKTALTNNKNLAVLTLYVKQIVKKRNTDNDSQV